MTGMNSLTIVYGKYGVGFFDGDLMIIYVHENDGNWRSEYFGPILAHYSITMEYRTTPELVSSWIKACTPAQAAAMAKLEKD